MLWIVIIAIVVIVMIRFASDNNKQANAVAKQGGMRKKYAVLINCLTEGQNCRILQEGGTYIRVGSISAGGSTIFDFTQTFGTITIQWISKSVIMGNHKLEWEFDEFLDQHQMFAKICHDVEAYTNNVLNKYK